MNEKIIRNVIASRKIETARHLAVAVTLAAKADSNGYVKIENFPRERLQVLFSKRTISNTIRELADLGLIIKVKAIDENFYKVVDFQFAQEFLETRYGSD